MVGFEPNLNGGQMPKSTQPVKMVLKKAAKRGSGKKIVRDRRTIYTWIVVGGPTWKTLLKALEGARSDRVTVPFTVRRVSFTEKKGSKQPFRIIRVTVTSISNGYLLEPWWDIVGEYTEELSKPQLVAVAISFNSETRKGLMYSTAV